MKTVSNVLGLMALVPASIALAADPYPYDAVFAGDGTYYGPTNAGNCAFKDDVPSMYDGMIPVAIGGALYGTSLLCGACIEGEASGAGSGNDPLPREFKAYVSDKCPECADGDLDFAEDGDGRWDIEWKFVECPGGDPSFVFEGSNDYYWKIQPRGTTSPVKKLWVNGEKAERTDDNFFVIQNGPYYGEQLVKTKTILNKRKKTDVSL